MDQDDEAVLGKRKAGRATDRLLRMLWAYPLTTLSAVSAAYFLLSWGNFVMRTSMELLFHSSVHRTPLLEKQLCKSRSLMVSVQRHQLELAREELQEDLSLSMERLRAMTGQLLDFQFYMFNFGTTDVEIVHPRVSLSIARQQQQRDNKGGYTAIIYYRLVKAGNDRIRNMLYKFAYRNGFHERDYSNCLGQDCRHSSGVAEQEKHRKPGVVDFFLPPTIRRYPFTFAREPLARFISGYKEIEYRTAMAASQGKPSWLLFSSATGTAERFKEFVRFILLHNGSGKLLSYPGTDELYHVAPLIGTLQQASQMEHSPLRLFKLETMEADWGRLARDVGQPNLWKVWSEKFEAHASATDPLRSAATAWEFLAPAVNMTMVEYAALRAARDAELKAHRAATAEALRGPSDTFEALRADLLPSGAAAAAASKARAASAKPPPRLRPMHPSLSSALYLRAVCRIYLADFVCADYPLPAVCADLHEEVMERSAHTERIERGRRWKRTILERLAPTWILRLVAEPFCIFLSKAPPECIGRFVVGDDEYNEDNEQEEDDEL